MAVERRYAIVAAILAVAAALCLRLAWETIPPAGAQDLFNCDNYDFQEDAQAVYDADTSGPNGLDGPPGEGFTGVEGVACEELPSRGGSPPTPDPPGGTTTTYEYQYSTTPLFTSGGPESGPALLMPNGGRARPSTRSRRTAVAGDEPRHPPLPYPLALALGVLVYEAWRDLGG